MHGDINVWIGTSRIHYEFTLHRNITVLRDKGATGKTSLLRMANRFSTSSSIKLHTTDNITLRVISYQNWDLLYNSSVLEGKNLEPQVFIVDENESFIKTKNFARFVWNSGCYFILITRDNLPYLSCSVKEMYRLNTIGRTTNFIPIYQDVTYGSIPVDKIQCITEDSKFGMKFFLQIYGSDNVISAYGKENVYNTLLDTHFAHPVVIVDGAAFGFNMAEVLHLIDERSGYLIVEESFEYMLLTSQLFSKYTKELVKQMKNIDCKLYNTWEQFFTFYLEKVSISTPLHYNKTSFNPNYTKPENVKKILHRYGLPIPDNCDCSDTDENENLKEATSFFS